MVLYVNDIIEFVLTAVINSYKIHIEIYNILLKKSKSILDILHI